jgi:predicted transcriptional regulator
MDAFGFRQAQLAATIGVSAPMLSQLIGAQRVKIGNPVVMQRVTALMSLADEASAGHLKAEETTRRIDEIRESTATLTGSTHTPPPASRAVDDAADALRGLLRAVASGQEIHDVAATLEPDHAALAELLRVYGLGSRSDAVEHLRRYAHLI